MKGILAAVRVNHGLFAMNVVNVLCFILIRIQSKLSLRPLS